MDPLGIFMIVWLAMIANSFWEAYVEGKNAWDKGKLGWKIKSKNHVYLTAYHFWLFWVMWPLMLSLPFVIYGFDITLFGVIISAYFTGLIVEDITWFVANPFFGLRNFKPKKVTWYPWLNLKYIHVPLYYVISVFIAIISWYFLWR